MGVEESAQEKRSKTHEKLRRLMSGRQTPLSEVAKPAAPSPFACYSTMSDEEIAREVESKRGVVTKQVEIYPPTVFHTGYQQSINMAPRKAKAGKAEAHKRVNAIMASGTKTKIVVLKPERPYKSAPTSLTSEMLEGIVKQLNKKKSKRSNNTAGIKTAAKSSGSPLDEAREASQQRLRALMSGKQTPVSEAVKAGLKGAMPQYRNMSQADIEALVERTREKVDRIIAEEKAEKAAGRAARTAAAAAKRAATRAARGRALPEGVTVVAEAGRSLGASPLRRLDDGHQLAPAEASVDEAREAAQRRLRSLMASKQTPASEAAKADRLKGAMPQYSKYSDAEITSLVENQKRKNANGVIVEERDQAALSREGDDGAEAEYEQQQTELAEAQGKIRAFMATEAAAANDQC